MKFISMVIPLRDEADAENFRSIAGVEVELGSEKVSKLSGAEVAVGIVLSLASSAVYDVGKASVKSLVSHVREYFAQDAGEATLETIVSFNGLQYDVNDPEALEALIADLETTGEEMYADPE